MYVPTYVCVCVCIYVTGDSLVEAETCWKWMYMMYIELISVFD
jgi:hypothetical protein